MYWVGVDSNWFKKLDLFYMVPMALYGPLFYMYVSRVLTGKRLPYKEYIFHFLPVFFVIVFFGKYFFLPLEFRGEAVENESFFVIQPCDYYGVLCLHILVYALIVSAKRWREKHKGNSTWLFAITVSFILFSVTLVVYYLLVINENLELEEDYIINISMGLFALITTYFGHISPETFQDKTFKQVLGFKKYQNTGLSKGMSLEYKKKLVRLIENDKLYLDSELRLDDLANRLGASRNHTSQIINEHFHMGFNDFINSHRIQEAKNMLDKNNENNKIIEIAYRSGFNNKVSFYKAFRKFIGMTPGEYLDISKIV